MEKNTALKLKKDENFKSSLLWFKNYLHEHKDGLEDIKISSHENLKTPSVNNVLKE